MQNDNSALVAFLTMKQAQGNVTRGRGSSALVAEGRIRAAAALEVATVVGAPKSEVPAVIASSPLTPQP